MNCKTEKEQEWQSSIELIEEHLPGGDWSFTIDRRSRRHGWCEHNRRTGGGVIGGGVRH